MSAPEPPALNTPDRKHVTFAGRFPHNLLSRTREPASGVSFPSHSMSSQLSTEISPLLSQPPSPASAQNAPHQAHSPPADKVQTGLASKIVAAMYSFVVVGLLTSSIGVILPHISHHYDISDLHVSFIFLVGPIGYIIAAQSNHFIHSRFGQRGVAILGPIFHLLSTLTIAVRPPFPVVLVAFAIVAAGTGLLDGSWCAWAASMSSANTVSGLLHGSFSIGAAIGPFLASTMISDKSRQWNAWYFVLVSFRCFRGDLGPSACEDDCLH